MANFLTNLLFEPKGKHDPNKTYTIKDTVMSADASKVYFALQDVPAGISLDNTDYWILQIDLSASKNAMDTAAANARTQTDATIASANTRVEDMMGKASEAVTSVADYAAKVGMRVKGETKITKGNPMTIYPDGGSLLSVETDIPIKQLGEGDPYLAGSGKNLCPPLSGIKTELGATFTPNADGSVTVSGTATAQSAVGTSQFTLKAGTYTVSGAPAVSAIGSYDIYVFKADGTGTIARSYGGINDTFTISNDTNVALAMRVPAGAVDTTKVFWPMIEAGSTATAFMPYSNIRPFVGYDELKLIRAGKNLLSLKNLTDTVTNRVNVSIYDNEIDLSPNDGGVGFQQWYGKMTIPESWRGKTFTYSIQSSVNGSSASVLTKSFLIENDVNGNEIGIAVNLTVTPGVASSGSFVVKENTVSFTILFRADQNQMFPTGAHMWFGQIQLEESPVMTAYMPYQGSIHTVQLGKTTYQGHYDWLTGKLTAEWAGYTFDGTEGWQDQTNNGLMRFALQKDVFDVGNNENVLGTKMCSHANEVLNANGVYGANNLFAMYTTKYLYINLGFNNLDAFKTYLAAQYAAGTPVQIVYKLATPFETQLAPNVITAVEDGGMNYIYGDADLTVEWVKSLETSLTEHSNAKVDANNEALLMDVAQKERSIGNPVVINDAVANVAFPNVETVFMPKQAGSGDPYPGGSGKNLCDKHAFEIGDMMSGSVVYTAGNYVSGYIAVKPNTAYTRSSNCLEGDKEIALFDANKNYIDRRWESSFITPNNCYYVRLEWEPTYPFDDSWFQLEEGSIATEYQPYSNIRPITGYDKLELNAAGKNLFNFNGLKNLDTTLIGGFYRATKPYLPAGKYVWSATEYHSNVAGITIRLINNDGSKHWTLVGSGTLAANVTIDSAEPLYLEINYIFSAFQTNSTLKAQLECGSTATPFEPYAGILHTVQIGETVYGGHYNWLTGKLVAEWVMKMLCGTEPWVVTGWTNPYTYAWWGAFPDAVEYGHADVAELRCSHYTAKSVNQVYYDEIPGAVLYEDNGSFVISSPTHTTVDAFKAALVASPAQVAYKLATPIEIQLDPTRITTIPGANTIFGDGEFTIDWFKSYKKVAEERENLLLDSFTDKVELSGNPIAMTPVGGVSFDSVVTEFAPKQSGSGDPYPAGGGKNLLSLATYESQNYRSVVPTIGANAVNLQISASDGGFQQWYGVYVTPESVKGKNVTFSINGFTRSFSNAETNVFIEQLDSNKTVISGVASISLINIVSVPVSKSMLIAESCAYIRIIFRADQNESAPVDGRVWFGNIQLELGTIATEYQPWENIRPISGYDKLKLKHAGKNLFDYKTATAHQGVFDENGRFTNTIGEVAGTGQYNYGFQEWNGRSTLIAHNVIMWESGRTKYTRTITVQPGTTTFCVRLFGEKEGCFWIENLEIPEGTKLTLSFDMLDDTPGKQVLDNIQIEIGGSASDYKPGHFTPHTVQIGQTIYGGKFDWTTGKLVAEWAMKDLSTALWTQITDVEWATAANAIPCGISQVGELVSDRFKATSFYNMRQRAGGKYLAAVSDNGSLHVYNGGESSPPSEGQIVYKLATPVEIKLIPTEIIALTGTNTLYGDGDTITAKFRQSKTISLEERLSALEAVFLNQ